ncbi:MAG: carboxypeptidase regulatory-like domain-containing protein [Planctomycetota bacterium]
MHKKTAALLVGSIVLIAAGFLVAPQLFGEEDLSLRRWDATDEIEVQAAVDPVELETANANPDTGGERTAADLGNPALDGRDEARIALTLRGRIVDSFTTPVASATVWLDYSRGGRGGFGGGTQRRVPDPVRTDAEGRFAFQGQTFRNLRVSLRVAHTRFAAGLFDKDLGQVGAEVDLGDLVLQTGGTVLGRVTDLEHIGIGGAEIRLSPENGNRWRMVRDREELIAAAATDAGGYYRIEHVPAGEWSASATAKMHTEGRSPTFAVEDGHEARAEDIRLGPGFEVTGYVRDVKGQPIAKANVSMRNTGRQGPTGDNNQNNGFGGGRRGGFGGFGGPGQDHSTTTDAQGRFFLEHLPGVTMRLEVEADGYLDYRQDGVDPKTGRPIEVTMQDGLRIVGTAVDAKDGQAVTTFAFRANRVRGLPVPGLENVDFAQLMQRMRDNNLDDATREQLRQQMDSLRNTFGDFGGRGQRGPGGPGGRGPDNGNPADPQGGGRRGQNGLGRAERHPGGTFVATGLQEGIYEVLVQSPDHALATSEQVEVRAGAPAPSITIQLDRGFYLAGVVLADAGQPIRDAQVQLRVASSLDNLGNFGRRNRNGGAGGNGNGGAGNGGNAPDFAAIGRDFQRFANGSTVQLDAKTDAEGEFTFRHLAAGKYRLQATAGGHANAEIEIELAGDRSDARLELGRLGSLVGKVFGVAAAEIADAHVAVMPMAQNGGGQNGGGPGNFGMRGGRGPGGGGPGSMFQRTELAADGSYHFDELEPGSYLVRAYVGSQQDIMRELMPQFFSGNLQADVAVKAGEATKYDLQVLRAQIGEVIGSVMHNGEAAVGFRVELQQQGQDGNTGNDAGGGGPGGGGPGGNRGPGGRGRWNNQPQATVGSSGTFTIDHVPAGTYTLRVQNSNRTTLHEETLDVLANARTERHLTIETAGLHGTVASKDGTAASELSGTVTLLAGVTELPADYNAGRRGGGNGGLNARVQDGAFQFDMVPPGNYLMVLSMRGRERTTAPVTVAAGGTQTVALEAGAIAAATGGNGGGPSAIPASGPGRGGAGGPGQGGGRGGRGGRGGQQGGTPNGGNNTGNGGQRGG